MRIKSAHNSWFIRVGIVLVLVCSIGFFSSYTHAQAPASLSLSVTPPLFQLTTAPGEYWASSIKVINANSYPLTIVAEVVRFDASGESGNAKFLPVLGTEGEGSTLADWITLEEIELTIPPEQSAVVPFSVRIPQDAPPGGHYAAILIGNKSVKEAGAGPQVGVSSFVSSLLFVRIAGDVVETGSIREFSADSLFYQKPETSFSLRFENTGNVHLLPQGEITIYNMWGKERGVIPINQKTDFGNVLPRSIRKFDFTWAGEQNPLEVGRFSAVAILTYGQEERKSVYANTYFWVIPVIPVLIVLASIFGIIVFVSWMVKLYIRRALELRGIYMNPDDFLSPHMNTSKVDMKMLVNPVVEGVMDLRSATFRDSLRHKKDIVEPASMTYKDFFKKYKRFFVSVAGLTMVVFIFMFFFTHVLVPERAFDITLNKEDGEVSISSEELIKDKLDEQNNYFNSSQEEVSSNIASGEVQRITIELLNNTGIPGRGAEIAVLLEQNGYRIQKVGNSNEEMEENRVYGNFTDPLIVEVIQDVENITDKVFTQIDSGYTQGQATNTLVFIISK